MSATGLRDDGGKQTYHRIPIPTKGPQHPFPDRDALCYVTRSGMLNLMVAQPAPNLQDGTLYTTVKQPLNLSASSKTIINHASFVNDSGMRS